MLLGTVLKLKTCEKKKLVKREKWDKFFSARRWKWIMLNLNEDLGVDSKWDWKILFGTAVWKLWYFRNQIVFRVIYKI